MEFCLSQGSVGPEISLLIENLRALGFDIEHGDEFTPQVSGALKMFQQSHHDYLGMPLTIDGRLETSTALAIDYARRRMGQRKSFNETELPPMSSGGSQVARRAALVGLAEYMRACGEQGGDNSGPDIERYRGSNSKKGAGWSVDFAAYCFRETAYPALSSLDQCHDANSLLKAAHSQGWVLPHLTTDLFPGDLIVWHFVEPSVAHSYRRCGHVGLVWAYDNGNITTLEGDRGDYPSLVRPFSHKVKSLVCATTNGRLKDDVSIIRIAATLGAQEAMGRQRALISH